MVPFEGPVFLLGLGASCLPQDAILERFSEELGLIFCFRCGSFVFFFLPFEGHSKSTERLPEKRQRRHYFFVYMKNIQHEQPMPSDCGIRIRPKVGDWVLFVKMNN